MQQYGQLMRQFVGIECMVTSLVDEYPTLMKWKKLTTFFICFTLFLFGLPCVTQVWIDTSARYGLTYNHPGMD